LLKKELWNKNLAKKTKNKKQIEFGYSASRYEFVLGVQICTGYTGNCGLLPQPINLIHGKVRLQMVLLTLGILIFIMIPSSGDDVIVSAAVVGPY
jgi:hypothetical protein